MCPSALAQTSTAQSTAELLSDRAEKALQIVRQWMVEKERRRSGDWAVPEVAAEEKVEPESPRFEPVTPPLPTEEEETKKNESPRGEE